MSTHSLARVRGAATLVMATIALTFAAARAATQTPNVPKTENARVAQRALTGSLAQTVDAWAKAADQAQWLAYAVPAARGDREVCCGNNWGNGSCGPCHLESSDHGSNINLRNDKLELEGPRRIIVLLRADARQVGKIRVVSENCTIDAGGLQVTWLGAVNPVESVKLLETFVDSKEFDEHGGDRISAVR
jgi:hypothetical protein